MSAMRLAPLWLAAVVFCGASAFDTPGIGRKQGAFQTAKNVPNNAWNASSFVIACAGNSIALGTDSAGLPWPTQLDEMLTAAGVTHTVYNMGRASYATEYLLDRANFSLTYKIPTDIDPLFDPTKNNVLIFHEVINDLYYETNAGATAAAAAATAYADVATYMRTVAHMREWYKVVVMPTPRDNTGVTQPAYENSRQAFLALVTSDPTFGGTVDAVWRVDQDSRLGAASSDSDGYYYYISGTSDTKVHWLFRAQAIAASAIYRILNARDAVKVPYVPQAAPYLAASYSAGKTGSVLTTSGGAATEGQAVATWVADRAYESGNAVQATGAQQPVYDSTGFGGHPSLTFTVAKQLVTVSNVTLGRGTYAITVNLTSTGLTLWNNGAPSNYKRLYLRGVTGGFSTYEAAGVNEAANTVADGTYTGAHVIVFVFDGTFAGQKIWVDGSAVTLTQYSTLNQNPGDALSANVLDIGHPTAGFAGKLGEVYASSIPFSTTERKNLEAYLGTYRGITVVP